MLLMNEAEVMIFVYGSLRSGQRNRNFLQPVEKALRKDQLSLCRTVAPFAMVSLYSKEYPFLLEACSCKKFPLRCSSNASPYSHFSRKTFSLHTRKITGELYQLSKSKLLELDEFEGNEYLRQIIQVEQNGDIYSAYAYIMNSQGASDICDNYIGKEVQTSSYYRPVNCGDWDAYLHASLFSQLLITAVLNNADNEPFSTVPHPLTHSCWLREMIREVEREVVSCDSVDSDKALAECSLFHDSLLSFLRSSLLLPGWETTTSTRSESQLPYSTSDVYM